MSKWALILFALISKCAHVESTACNSGWMQYGNKKYCLSSDDHTFTGCQEEVCGEVGGTLVTIEDASENAFLKNSLLGHHFAFIGLFEAGADESGDWSWVDGHTSDYTNWEQGEPNNWCLDEDCAVVGPDSSFKGWIDASCNIMMRCLCQDLSTPSYEYTSKVSDLEGTSDGDYDDCEDDEEERENYEYNNEVMEAMQGEMNSILAIVVIILIVVIITLTLVLVVIFRDTYPQFIPSVCRSSETEMEMASVTPYALVSDTVGV